MNTLTKIKIDRKLGKPVVIGLNILARMLGFTLRIDHSFNKPPRTIAICKFMGLGNIIQATPLIQTLRKNYPDAVITFITRKSNREIIELIPFIDSTYPTTSERCIIGHSAGGLFAIYALENQPNLFNSFICIDPSLWYDNELYVKKMPEFLLKNKDIKKKLFITLSNEKDMGVFPFIDVLVKNAPEGFVWDYIHYKNETHNSLGFKSICAGLEMIYKNWKPLNDSIK